MSVTSYDDVIDSRDLIEEIDFLESEIEEIEGYLSDEDYENESEEVDYKNELDDLREKLNPLKDFAEQVESYASDYLYGATIIRESYFTEYAMELIKDIGDLPAVIPSYIAIDEEETAQNLMADYSTVDFDGETYYVR